MASCIHPFCGCKVYQDRKNCKGTLLELRLGCNGCGHHSSEHRQLTAVDRLLEKEVAAAADNRCTHCIPIAEIPRSPLFGPYDPIPIPFESIPPKEEGGVPCTCLGFQAASLVQLWQKFRTSTMKNAIESLPRITCSFCQHSLEKHQKVDSTSCSSSFPILPTAYPKLALKVSAKLGFRPLNRQCAQLLLPKDPTGDLTLVGLSGSDGGLNVVIHTHVCDPERPRGEDKVDTSSELEAVMTHRVDAHPLNGNPEQCEGGGNASLHISSEEEKEISCGPLTLSDVVHPTDQAVAISSNTTANKGRKRKLSQQLSNPRRSSRLASKKPKVESMPNKGSLELNGLGIGESGSTPGKSQSVTEVKSGGSLQEEVLKQHVETFVESLGKSGSFTRHKMPKDVSSSSIEVMSATYFSVPDSRRKILILAVGSADGQMFVCTPLEAVPEVQKLQAVGDPPAQVIRSLSWQEQLQLEKSNNISVCAGNSNGTICVWKVQLEAGTTSKLQCHPAGQFKDTSAEITVCRWSSDRKYLAAGSMLGEVVLYSDIDTRLQYLQTLHCCGASVTSFAWYTTSDYILLAVGGSDDCVQLLHCKRPSSAAPRIPDYSILKYLHTDSGKNKFIHTHCYRGHLSFISDLMFLSSGSSAILLSLGWDGQVLFWQGGAACSHSPHTPVAHTKGRRDGGLPYVDREPLGGFKMGPSASAQFIPLSVCGVLGSGVLVMSIDRQGGVSVINYV